jgi:hypothetical protein
MGDAREDGTAGKRQAGQAPCVFFITEASEQSAAIGRLV